MKIITIAIALFSSVLLSCKEETKPKPVVVENVAPSATAAEDAKREEIIAYAKKYLGTAYCYAGGSPEKGFDCSGFVNFVFKNFGVELPRSSSQFKNIGKTVKPEEIKVGDVLVFYGYRDRNSIGHLGIVCEANGMKSKFIHSSSGKEMAVTVSELGSDQYTRRFYKAVDVLTTK
ncbi:MAG: peptidoglycan endopeptidase [Flavobacterium sp.]|nr:MAG: peptidoglycan endopeptidase [Flavobacterium sp.]